MLENVDCEWLWAFVRANSVVLEWEIHDSLVPHFHESVYSLSKFGNLSEIFHVDSDGNCNRAVYGSDFHVQFAYIFTSHDRFREKVLGLPAIDHWIGLEMGFQVFIGVEPDTGSSRKQFYID